jgi:hypothetical protein
MSLAWGKEGSIKGPVGPVGPPIDLTIGTVLTVPWDQPAFVNIRGFPPAQILDFGIPQGTPGTAAIEWDDVQNKPATFPPTLPIPSSGVTDLDAKQASQDAALAAEVTNRTNADATLQTNINTETAARIANDGALQSNINLKANSASPTFTGDPTAPTPAAGDNDNSLATTAFVQGEIAGKAPLASPLFTGDPRAPTPATADSDTSIATTAFVKAAIAAAGTGGATVSGTAPASPTLGQFWWNTGTEVLSLWDGSAWKKVLASWA